jgi:hypothetical protein
MNTLGLKAVGAVITLLGIAVAVVVLLVVLL